jgi:hypothetical protein
MMIAHATLPTMTLLSRTPSPNAMKQAPNNEACHSPYFALSSFPFLLMCFIGLTFQYINYGKDYDTRQDNPTSPVQYFLISRVFIIHRVVLI